jgi:glutamine amidotransferase
VCRHLAWLGTPRTLAELVLDPPSGLLRQSYAPRRQRHGLLNADGWGVGFVDGTGTVRRWRSALPLWSDASFASIAPVLCAPAVLAAVRSASTGMPAEASACAPFTDGRWLLSHNGLVAVDAIPSAPRAESVCDSALLAAHLFDRGIDGYVDTVRAVAAADPDARLTLLLTDGTRIRGLTWGDGLCYLQTAAGVAVASEPWDDDPGWVDVPDRHTIEVTGDGRITVTDLQEA